jgi:hypothetical protein
MKYVLLFAVSALCFSVQAQAPQAKSLEWLIGSWERTNNKPGYMTIESWQMDANGDMKGMGVMLKGTDTVFVEKLRITVRDNVLNYVADVPENKGLVYFPFTSQGATSFVCENPAHDFPKKISYDLSGTSLKAIVSANDKSIAYDFKKR